MSMKLFLTLLSVFVLLHCGQAPQHNITAEQKRDYANALYNRELYAAAVQEYEELLDAYTIDENLQANISYTIGNIYFERLNDYQQALAFYLRIKHLYPESHLMNDVNKRVVECLERLDKSADAAQALRETTALNQNPSQESRSGEIVAAIGDRHITMGDLEFEMERAFGGLPSDMQPKDITRQDKLEFLKQYLTVELLYNTAKRKGLDREKSVIDGTFQAKKQLMANMLVQQELEDKVTVEDTDIELYYQRHKEDFTEKDDDGNVTRQKTLNEVRQEVAQHVYQEKATRIIDDLKLRMMEAENVTIFQDKVQ